MLLISTLAMGLAIVAQPAAMADKGAGNMRDKVREQACAPCGSARSSSSS